LLVESLAASRDYKPSGTEPSKTSKVISTSGADEESETALGLGLFDNIKWGTFKQLKERLGFKGSLHELAKEIIDHPDKYSKKAFKKAQFYHNVIGGDLHIDINSHNNEESSSDEEMEGEGIDNPDLYEKAKQIADKTYSKPSAYKSGFIVKKYKELGGTYSGKKKNKGIGRWFKEKWEDVGKKEYPVYRPTKRVSKDTPLTPDEIDPANLKKQIALKQKIKGKSNLPAFKGGVLGDVSDSEEEENEDEYVQEVEEADEQVSDSDVESEGDNVYRAYPEADDVMSRRDIFHFFHFNSNVRLTRAEAERIFDILQGDPTSIGQDGIEYRVEPPTVEERRFMMEIQAPTSDQSSEEEEEEEEEEGLAEEPASRRRRLDEEGNSGRGFRKFGGDLMMQGEDDISDNGNDTGSDDEKEIVETKSNGIRMLHPAMESPLHFRHPNAQANVHALQGGLLKDDLQKGYNKVVPKSLRPAVNELGMASAKYVGRQLKPKAEKVYHKVVPKSLRPAVGELAKDTGSFLKRKMGFGLGAGLGYGMEGMGAKKYAKEALKTYVPASMRKGVKDLAKAGAKELYESSGAKSAVHEAKEHYGRAKEQYEEVVPKDIRRSLADLGKASLKEGRKMTGMGADPLHPTVIPHGTGMKKGSQEMKEKMARLRAMRKKKMSGGMMDAEPPRSRSYTTNPELTGGELPPRSRMP